MEGIRFKDFLESIPPGKEMIVVGFIEDKVPSYRTNTPQLQLHCTSEGCQGIRGFLAQSYVNLSIENYNDDFFDICMQELRKI